MAKSTGRGHDNSADQSRARVHDTLHDDAPPFEERQTLPTGASFKSTWKLPALRPSERPGAPMDVSNASGVRPVPAATPAHPSSDWARGQTLISMVPGAAMPEPAVRHSVFQQNEPRDTLEPTLPAEVLSATRRAALSRTPDTVQATSVHRVGESTPPDTDSTRPPSGRPTDPFGHPAHREAPSPSHAPERTAHAHATPELPRSSPSGRPQPSAAVTPAGSRPAWYVAVACIGAVAAAVATVMVATEPSGTFSDTAAHGEPHMVQPAPLARPAASPPAVTPSAPITELASIPPGAEIVLSGAVVANTPARITRGNYEADYLVRLPGYDSQLIRIGPKSPAQVTVHLLPLAAEPAQ